MVPATASGSARGAAAPAVTGYFATGGFTTVRTSTHKKLKVSVWANRDAGDPKARASVNISTPSGAESHNWRFQAPKSALGFSSKSGTIKLPKVNVKPYGTIKLKFKRLNGWKSSKCHTQVTSKSAKVKVSGKFFFNARSTGKHKWGTLGSAKKSFSFATKGSSATISYDTDTTGCYPDYVPPAYRRLAGTPGTARPTCTAAPRGRGATCRAVVR